MLYRIIALYFVVLCLTGCVRNQPTVVVITATFTPLPGSVNSVPIFTTPDTEITFPAPPIGNPTPDPTRPAQQVSAESEYTVHPGDTLSGIATSHGVSLEALLAVNNLPDANVLSVGQVIKLPEPPKEQTTTFKIVPDSRLVRAPGSQSFEVNNFINQQTGYIRTATDLVDEVLLSSSEVVDRVSLEYSVDARLLLALLEYRTHWLSQTDLSDDAKTFPIQGMPSPDGFDRSGLYKQLAWAANRLNQGYYGWKYRDQTVLEFDDGTRVAYAPGLNAGTVAVQYFLSIYNTYALWEQQVSSDGLYRLYNAYFGDPFAQVVDPLVPTGLVQPTMNFPFTKGETWYFTGGPHGGWGTGSAWSAIDFAPPDDRPDGSPSCYVSQFWATAVAPGLIARSGGGVVILDLDGDGDETTGWTVLYLHMASEGRVAVGKSVQAGDLIGHPSCEGGVSNGTHMHIARRYNGEWLPVYCDQCIPGLETPSFVLSDWLMIGYTNQEYQGYMVKGSEQRVADQGRLNPENRVTW